MPKDIWIGLQFLFSTRENKWIDESKLLYSNFHPLLTGRLRKIPLDVSSDFSWLLSNELWNIDHIEKKKGKNYIRDQIPQFVLVVDKQGDWQ